MTNILRFIVYILIITPNTLHAIGGDDSNPANQINSVSQDCADDLLEASRNYISTRVTAINTCITSYLNCESAANSTAAEACRAALLEKDVGVCAEGVLDNGLDTNANTINTINSNASINQGLEDIFNTIQANCFSMSVDMGSSGTGLGYSNDVINDSNLFIDELTKVPGGIGCQADEAIRSATPLIDTIADHLKSFNNKCIAVSNGQTLYQGCSVDADCGAASGRCGKIAFVFKNGGSSGFPRCASSCGAGQFLTAGKLICVPCDIGRFNSAINATSCLPCDPGTFTNVTGSTSCTQCPRGFVQPNTDSISCTPCDPGKFKSTTGGLSCDTCGAGTYSGIAAVACTNCPKGSFSAANAATCTPCSPGEIAANEQSTACSPCEAGTYANLSGSSSCISCPKGTFAGSQGALTCTLCEAGKFAANEQSTSCTSCDPGTYSTAGASSCTDCPAGTFSAQSGSASCIKCSAGTYSDGGDASCSPCAAGSYSEAEGASSCTKALAGTFVTGEGQTKAAACLPGTYSAEAGASECAQCSPGTYSSSAGAPICISCPKGQIAKKFGSKTCKVCPSGKSNRARTKCVA